MVATLPVAGCHGTPARQTHNPGGGVTTSVTCGGAAQVAGAPVATRLPALAELTNVDACVNTDAVNVGFDPVDGAQDYRIYPLPKDEDITLAPDGTVVVKNAIYRCAGTREALYMLPDQPTVNDGAAGGATILNGDVEGFTRAQADASLGYVYTTPGSGRIPVYVLGNGDAGIEEGLSCGRPIFNSTRPKTYTTDAMKRTQLIAKHARDDGIAFYVPAAASASTRPVYEGTFGDSDTLRWIDGPEGTMRNGHGQPIFNVLTATADGAAPLMRVHVLPYCSKQHDELVAGSARYNKVVNEGDQPLNQLRWSGLTAQTILVVEALDQRCPYQGVLSPVHADAHTDSGISYPAFMTLDDLRSASPTGEVFVNGQNDAMVAPKAIARSFIQVAPASPPSLDYFASFPEAQTFETFHDIPWAGHWASQHLQSASYDLTSYADSQVFFGTMLGELWFAYSDVGGDVNGKIRLTPSKTATVARGTYLHVTTEMDLISTARRYPQILISDQLAPVQESLTNGVTLIVQPKDTSPTLMQVQICDHRTWDVNNQCPLLPTFVSDFKPTAPLPGELTGTDNAVKLDVYVSSDRIYLLLNDKPYSCTDLPAKADDGSVYHPPSGAVSVTWGDVLYHSAVDFSVGGVELQGNSYLFHRTHMHTLTRRHFDNIGFASGSAAPAWDESLVPCVASM
jgi:hypothetical protein